MRKFQWTPNFYIVMVGPPGVVSKSTTARIGTRLLQKVPGIKFGPPSITWQKLVDSLSDAAEYVKVVDNDGKEELVAMSALNIPVSELGTFFKVEDASLVDVLVDLWDGQLTTFAHSTKTSGKSEITNPWLNILGCTTPSWLKAQFPEHMIGGGLTSRIIFVYGDEKQTLVPYPDEMKTSKEYLALEEGLVEDLKEIAMLSGAMTLTPSARAWGHKWYEEHWKGQRESHLASDRYGGYIARKQTHIHKIAIVLSVAESSSLQITDVHLQMAEGLLKTVEPHMIKVFESIGVVEESRHVKELIPFIRMHQCLTPEELFPMVMNLMSNKDFNDALHAGVRGGLIRVGEHQGKKGLMLAAKQ
jgi:hypothetical protein